VSPPIIWDPSSDARPLNKVDWEEEKALIRRPKYQQVTTPEIQQAPRPAVLATKVAPTPAPVAPKRRRAFFTEIPDFCEICGKAFKPGAKLGKGVVIHCAADERAKPQFVHPRCVNAD
jgi:hypothetical protein